MSTGNIPLRSTALLLSAIALLITSLCAGVHAQDGKRVLDRAEKALGRSKDVKKVRSWRKRGLIVRSSDDAGGEILLQGLKPDKFNIAYDIRGFETEIGYNGRSGWVRDSREGLRTLTGDASRDLKTRALFRNWLWTEYKKQKFQISSSESVTLDGKPTIAVTLTNPQGVPIRLYFDAFSNMLLREELRDGDGTALYDYSDYRPVNGVMEAFGVTAYIDGKKYVIRFDQISHNPEIAESEFDFPIETGEPLPDISKLLSELQANQEEIEKILEDYSYKQDIVKRELTDEGELKIKESETFQLSFYKGYRIQRLIARDGKPLSADDQKDADEEAQDRVKEIEKEIAKEEAKAVDQSSNGTPDREGRQISIAEVLRASKLLNPRRERLKGRDVVVFDFEPDPDFDFKNAKSFLKFFGKTAGVMWIDEKDKQVARIEAVLFDSYKVGGGILAKLRKGASFTLEQERVNDEIWMPTFADINLSVRVLLFGGVKVNQLIRSYDFKKFKTEVEDARIDEVPDQQDR
jgi:outer membrane lipoprotein-sorting protein